MTNLLQTNTLPIKEPEWCPVCGFSKTGDTCLNCIKIAEDRQRVLNEEKNALASKLGGNYAYGQYTAENFTDKIKITECSVFPNENIYLWGGVGSGKTHLATALIREQKNFTRLKIPQLYRAIRQCKTAVDEELLIKRLSSNPLMIDDLGAEKLTEFSAQTLYEVIDRRYEIGGGGMVITSNFDLNGISQKLDSDRISSRLFQMCKIVKLSGDDFRLRRER
jgi:DNA replication protein DnaC